MQCTLSALILGISILGICADHDLLTVEEAAKLKYACPERNVFCIPRLFCPLRNLIYDRETIKFIQKDKFKDEYGCGAVGPTYTYVCCSTLDRLETSFVPTSTLWFYPGTDENRPVGVNMTIPYPALLPWPKDATEQHGMDDKSERQDGAQNLLSDDDRAMLGIHTIPSHGENPGIRSDRMIPSNPVFQPFVPQPFVPPFQFLPMPGFFPFNFFQRMLMPPPFMEHFPAWPFPQGNFFGHQSFQFSSPEGTHAENVMFLPDGSTRRIVTSHLPEPGPHVENSMIPKIGPDFPESVVNPTIPKTDLNFPESDSAATGDGRNIASEIENPFLDAKSRSRRAVEDPRPAVASGGIWKGVNETENDIPAVDSRMQLPTANDLWASRLPQEPPYSPLPIQMNVNNDRCGLSVGTGINARVLPGRKIDGSLLAETSFGEFPWHVAILNGITGDYLCGGTIISARFVLTVAHCVRRFQFSLLFVRVGDWDLYSTQEMLPSYDVEVAQITVHEDFYAGNLQNDIALLRLKYPLDFQYMPHVGASCLPPSNNVQYTDCVVTGWGQQLATDQAFGDDRFFSRILQKSTQKIMYPRFCESALRPYLGRFYQFPTRGFICAYDSDGKDACFGDGGGALVCKVNVDGYVKRSRYHVVGLVSWGVGCGLTGVPAAYTAIWDYLDWIQDKVSRFDPYQDFNTGFIAPRSELTEAETPGNRLPITPEPQSKPKQTATKKSTTLAGRVVGDVIDLAFP